MTRAASRGSRPGLASPHLAALTLATLAGALALAPLPAQPPQDPPPGEYVKKATRSETARATLASHGLPTLEGAWYHAGPFDNSDRQAFIATYPPERKVDLKDTYTGKAALKFGWTEFRRPPLGTVVNLARLFPGNETNSAAYLYHEFESPREFRLPVSFGCDDTITVWFNGERVLHERPETGASPDQFKADLKVKAGKNTLLIKVCQYGGSWAVYVSPELPAGLVSDSIRKRLDRDFPPASVTQATAAAAGGEARFYRVDTVPLPPDCVLEVGGLAFRPDGKLLVCTRRGEVWLVHNPLAANVADVRMTRFAAGLHEALGLYCDDNHTVYAVQRAELTKLVDTDGDGVADEFVTVCDKWGVSGDYHEFAFGPARDKDGNFFITLNVGFGGGHQSKAPWRGWCVKVSPDGALEPWASGLRSPNGINFSPDGDLFYCDNQGEWVASNKMHHVRRGGFYGHPAGLRWAKDSPFAGLVPEKVASGMLYDGRAFDARTKRVLDQEVGRPDLDPPCIWFPYGRMGQSVSEPVWDTTGGKFGPFAGQCFVGDQTRSTVMRVALERVNGVYQGACFPFRSGLQSGVNRLAFAPDGTLFVGQTARGWGSLGGKPYGLQRIAYTGTKPFEVHDVRLTPGGFDLWFTKPVDPASVSPTAASAGSFTYVYWSTYGCEETDKRAEPVSRVRLSADGRTLSVAVPGLRPGRVYELRVDGVRSADGEPVLHPEAYYTLNELVR